MDPLKAVKEYGSKDQYGRMGMYYTMKVQPNEAKLFLSIEDSSISVRHTDGHIVAEWKLEEIERRFNEKVKNVLLVKAKTQEKEGKEHFLFHRAKLLSGGTTLSILKNQFEKERFLVDLRLHEKGTMARNHGTGFRVLENHLEDFYQTAKEVEF